MSEIPKFFIDACNTVMSDDVKLMQRIPPTPDSFSRAAGLGVFVADYYEQDFPEGDGREMMFALRDGMPMLDIPPETANVVVESAVDVIREKTSTGSRSESGFIPEGAIGKTVGLSYKPEAQ